MFFNLKRSRTGIFWGKMKPYRGVAFSWEKLIPPERFTFIEKEGERSLESHLKVWIVETSRAFHLLRKKGDT